MFGISLPEILIVMVVVLLVFGPDRLPEIARSLGKTFGIIREQSNVFRKEFYNSVYKPVEELEDKMRTEGRNLLAEDNNSKEPSQNSEEHAKEEKDS